MNTDKRDRDVGGMMHAAWVRWMVALMLGVGAGLLSPALSSQGGEGGKGLHGAIGKPVEKGPEPIMLIVMDPLAKEMACACVKGYAQRDYRKLAARLLN